MFTLPDYEWHFETIAPRLYYFLQSSFCAFHFNDVFCDLLPGERTEICWSQSDLEGFLLELEFPFLCKIDFHTEILATG